MVEEVVDLITQALQAERSVFEHFSQRAKVSDNAEAFATPEAKNVAHWNIVYPDKAGWLYTTAELKAAETFFNRFSIQGHVMTFEDSWQPLAVEKSQYFIASPQAFQKDDLEVDVADQLDEETLDTFSEVVGAAFNFDQAIHDYFRKVLKILDAKVESRFWMAKEKGKKVATASTFRSKDDSDCLFNVAVLPGLQGRHIGSRLIQRIVSKASRPLYTYSENPIMIESILPKAGFQDIGAIYVVPIDVYAAHQKK